MRRRGANRVLNGVLVPGALVFFLSLAGLIQFRAMDRITSRLSDRSPSPYPAALLTSVAEVIHDRTPLIRGVAGTLAAMGPLPMDLPPLLRRTVWEIFLVLRCGPEEALRIYLHVLPIKSPSGLKITGIEKASQSYFGLSTDVLTLGEMIVLIHTSARGITLNPAHGKSAILSKREDYLASLFVMGSLGVADYIRESSLPLSMASVHVPIW